MICTFVKKLFENPSNGYCVALFNTNDTSVPLEARHKQSKAVSGITFTGFGYKFPATNAINLELTGKWQKSQKYGIQFAIEQFAEIIPPTIEGIIGYLSSGLIHGVSEITARKITDKFGLQSLDIIENEPERLNEIYGLSDKKIEKIVESFSRNKELRNIVSFLKPYGITLNKASKIYDEYGIKSMEVINERPYELCKIKGFGFVTVDAIALKLKRKPNDNMRIKACAEHVIKETESAGHVFIPQQEFRTSCFSLLNKAFKKTVVTADEIRSALVEEIKAGRYKNNSGLIYRPYMFEAEVGLARMLTERKYGPVRAWGDVETAILNSQAARGLLLSDAQTEAVKMCFENNISVITGGPGTGKTTVLKVIIDVYKALTGKTDILLAAPTGKAAKRMAEGTGILDSKTLHSALCLTGDDEQEENSAITQQLVIVDEMSMVDIKLAYRLLSNVSPDTTIVLVGDADQLPSVGPGNVFRDILRSECIPCTCLNMVFRQSGTSRIILNAEKIRADEGKLLYGNDFNFIDADSEENALEIIKHCYLEEIKTSGIDNVQILTPRRTDTQTSAKNINNIIRDIVNPYVGEDNELYCDGEKFRVNDRVLQIKNKDGINNGDVGVIQSVFLTPDETKEAIIKFSGGIEKAFDERALDIITLAYAMTIHKSQGSEYSTVIIPILMSNYHMLKRNLIYTAITRAKSKVIIVGEKRALMTAIHSNDSRKRNSFLAERIKQYVEMKEKEDENSEVL